MPALEGPTHLSIRIRHPELVHSFLSQCRRLREGVPIPATLAEQLRALCARCGAPFVLE